MSKSFIFSSESVTEGHPDKVCDTVSDAILDACLEQDPKSRVACETLVKDNILVLAGEITTGAKFNYEEVAREAVRKIGYDKAYADNTEYSYTSKFDADGLFFMNLLGKQSQDIAQGVVPMLQITKIPPNKVREIKGSCLAMLPTRPKN